jgi:hypothetical protein
VVVAFVAERERGGGHERNQRQTGERRRTARPADRQPDQDAERQGDPGDHGRCAEVEAADANARKALQAPEGRRAHGRRDDGGRRRRSGQGSDQQIVSCGSRDGEDKLEGALAGQCRGGHGVGPVRRRNRRDLLAAPDCDRDPCIRDRLVGCEQVEVNGKPVAPPKADEFVDLALNRDARSAGHDGSHSRGAMVMTFVGERRTREAGDEAQGPDTSLEAAQDAAKSRMHQ